MARPIVDQILKEMTELHAERIIQPLFPGEKFHIIFSKLDKELTVKTRLADWVVMLKTSGGKRLLHLEFQLRYNRRVPERMFVYAGALTAKYRMKVASVLFLIKPSRTVGDFGVYSSDLFGKTTNEFSFLVIRVWELREKILSGDESYRIFAPLLLEIEPKPSVALLRKVREVINLEPNAQRRAEFVGFAIPIAQRHFGLEVIQSICKEAEMIKSMKEVAWDKIPPFGDVLREAVKAKEKEAKKEAKKEAQKGEVLGMQEMLIEILTAQFGNVSGKTIRTIHAIQTPGKLKKIVRKSLKAESLAEVQKLLMASKVNGNSRNGSALQQRK